MSINRQMARGALWTVGLRMFDRGIGFVSTLVLVRLLLPEDFGLVAMATVFMHLLFAVSDFSVHVPLIQKPKIDRHDMDGAWTLQCVIGFGQGALLIAIAHPVSSFYGEPRLILVMYVLAAIASIGGVRNIGIVMFQRDMQFNLDFVLRAVQRVGGFVVTLFVALTWRSYWALLIGMLASTIFGLILSYTMHPFRPRISTARWRDLIGFSKWMLLSNLFAFIGTRAPDFFLGRIFGARSVGLYSISFEIGMLPASELVAPINRVALPGYSRMQKDEGGLQKGFLDVIGMISLVGIPAAVGIASIADLLVPVLLGKNWLDAIPVIQYLAIAGAVWVLTTNSASIMLALGRPKLLTAWQALRMVLLLPALYYGAITGGVEGVAVSYLIISVIALMLNVGIVLNVLSLSLFRYLEVVYRPVASAALMYVIEIALVLPWLVSAFPGQGIVGTSIAVVAGATVFVVFEATLWVAVGRPVGAEARVLQILGESLKTRAPSISSWLEKQKIGS